MLHLGHGGALPTELEEGQQIMSALRLHLALRAALRLYKETFREFRLP
jgi:hypothetical protein